MLRQRIILSDSAILGSLTSWDSYTSAGTGETVENAISGTGQRAGLYCLKTAITYGSAGTPLQGRTSEFVSVNSAASATAGVFCKAASSSPKGIVELLCYDAGSNLLGTLTLVSSFTAPATHTDKGATINAVGGAAPAFPATTTKVKLRFYQSCGSSAQNGGIYWDDAYITNGGANLLANPGLGDGSATAKTFVFNSPPPAIRGYDPTVNVAQVITGGNVLYSQQLGANSAIIALVWGESSPLSQDDLDGGFNWLTLTQTAGTQSLSNFFMNVAVGSLNDVYLYRGSDMATVTIMNNSLGFKPIPKHDDRYAGQLVLRIQYA